VLRADLLRPWAHWITPELEPKRFDTRFFVAALPTGQRTRDVGGEADRVAWVRPGDALAAADSGAMGMLPPTAFTLSELAPYETGSVVVDPGPSDEAHIARVAEHGPVRLIVLTHGHLDHSEGAARLHELTGAPVVARDPKWCIDAEPLADGRAEPVEGVE